MGTKWIEEQGGRKVEPHESGPCKRCGEDISYFETLWDIDPVKSEVRVVCAHCGYGTEYFKDCLRALKDWNGNDLDIR